MFSQIELEDQAVGLLPNREALGVLKFNCSGGHHSLPIDHRGDHCAPVSHCGPHHPTGDHHTGGHSSGHGGCGDGHQSSGHGQDHGHHPDRGHHPAPVGAHHGGGMGGRC